MSAIQENQATREAERAGGRPPLSHDAIVKVALRYIDEHGLEALSMHKLGAELGVKAMSLYNHVDGKDAMLDSLVGLLWSEVELPEPHADWREVIWSLAHSLRDLVHRHPHAAPLLMTRPVLPEAALIVCDGFLRALRAGGIEERRAVELLRTIIAYGLGYALCEVSWSNAAGTAEEGTLRRLRRISQALPATAPEELLDTALEICGDCDMAASFTLGIDLMLRGLETG